MSGVQFLDSSKLKPFPVKITHVVGKNATTVSDIVIYPDETSRDVYMKLAQKTNQSITSDHIFAWCSDTRTKQLTPLGFSYPSVVMDHPYKNKQLDTAFITESGSRKSVITDTSYVYKIIETYSIKAIIYTTCLDFLRSYGLDPLQEITEEQCVEATSFTREEWYNGKLRKYWPKLSFESIFQYPKSKKRVDKIKRETLIQERQEAQVRFVYSYDSSIEPLSISSPVFTLSNKVTQETTVHLYRLFTDISLGTKGSLDIPFSKLSLDDYGSTFSKLLKRTIAITQVDSERYVTKDVFLKWFRGQVTSIPNTPLSYMDERNSVIFKLYKDGSYVSVVIYSTGVVKLVLNVRHMKIN